MNLAVYFSAVLAVVIFGASPVAAKIAVLEIPAMDVALPRTVLGGLLALALALRLKIRFPKEPQH